MRKHILKNIIPNKKPTKPNATVMFCEILTLFTTFHLHIDLMTEQAVDFCSKIIKTQYPAPR